MKHRLSSLIFFIFLFAVAGCRVTYVSETEIDYARISEEVSQGDEDIDEMISPYRQKLKASMDEVISILDVDLVKERPESNMGNWLVDAFYEKSNALVSEELDFAVLNQGGMRLSSLSKGPVLTGEIYELIPFDNIISVIEANGREVMSFMHHIAEGKGWPISSQLRMQIKDKKAHNVTISGLPVNPDKMYRFAVPDYIAGGGSGSAMLKTLKRTDYDHFIRDLTIEYLKAQHKKDLIQSPSKEGRIVNLDHE